jgi:hypothetical protein
MTAITKLLGGSVAAAALAAAAPAAAQYYPGYGNPYGNAYPGYGYPGPIGPYGYNVPGGSQVAAGQCSAAVQQRLGGYGGYGDERGLTITSVEIRRGGGYKVRGVAGGGGYGGPAVPFACRTDPRGFVTDVDVNGGYYRDGYNGDYYRDGYDGDPYGNLRGPYGYVRY